MILAGDIGGTNARLALFGVGQNGFQLVSVSIFPSRDYKTLDEIVKKFVETVAVRPEKACFGVAGPVRNGRVETSNLPWVIESQKLADELKIGKALLINDLEANAWGIAALDPSDIVTLSHGKGGTGGVGNRCVIAAGTGLGEAGMFWDGKEHQIFACEGGHTEFGPRNELEIDLLRYLQGRYGHVSYERIVSGPDTPPFVNLFDAKLFDILMIMVSSGRERTLEEYTGLLEGAGWTYRQTWYPASEMLGVVEGVKA